MTYDNKNYSIMKYCSNHYMLLISLYHLENGWFVNYTFRNEINIKVGKFFQLPCDMKLEKAMKYIALM